MKTWNVGYVIVAAAVLMGMTLPGARAEDPTGGKPTVRSLMFNVCYVRETRDQTWSLRIEGKMPRGPGLYYFVRNEEGAVVQRGEIPWGEYSAEKPLLIKVKPDGVVGDYAIHVIGQQDNFTGLVLPLTTLPLEVYGDRGFGLGYGTAQQARLVSFQVDKPTLVTFSGFRDHYRILNADGSVLVESKTAGLPVGAPDRHFESDRDVVTRFNVEPGKVYWIHPYGVLYFGPKDPLYLTYDPKKWFAPKVKWDHMQDKWWKGLAE